MCAERGQEMGQSGLCRVQNSFSNGEGGPKLGGGFVLLLGFIIHMHTYILLYDQLFHDKTDQKYLAIKNVP